MKAFFSLSNRESHLARGRVNKVAGCLSCSGSGRSASFLWQEEYTCDTVWNKLCTDLYLSKIFKKNLPNHLPIHDQSHLTAFSHTSRNFKLLPGYLDSCPLLEITYIQGPYVPEDLFSTPSHTREPYIQFHKGFEHFAF